MIEVAAYVGIAIVGIAMAALMMWMVIELMDSDDL